MQNRRAAHARPHTRAAHRDRSAHPSIARDLAALVHPHADTYGADARTHTRRDTARTQAHTNAERPHRNTDTDARRCGAAGQCSGNRQDHNKLFHNSHCQALRATRQMRPVIDLAFHG